MENKLLIIAMSDLSIQNKAPARRMKAISDSFKQMDIPVNILSGSRKQRRKRILHFLLSDNLKNYIGIYVESSNSGMLFSEFLLLLIAKIKKVPISVYIRDGYPLFRKYWLPKICNQNIANILWLISYFSYMFLANTMYFPSKMLMNKFSFKNRKLLLPGMPSVKKNLGLTKNHSIFYAGGIGQQYDLDSFLQACKRLSIEINLSVTIFCRKNEANMIDKWVKEDWLSIQHKNLEELDFQPQIGIIPLKKNDYSDLAFPVKLFDYISINAVLIASDATTMKTFIEDKDIGLIVKSENIQSYYNQLKLLLTDKKLYSDLKKNVLQLQKSEDISWKNRCQIILNDFGYKYDK